MGIEISFESGDISTGRHWLSGSVLQIKGVGECRITGAQAVRLASEALWVALFEVDEGAEGAAGVAVSVVSEAGHALSHCVDLARHDAVAAALDVLARAYSTDTMATITAALQAEDDEEAEVSDGR